MLDDAPVQGLFRANPDDASGEALCLESLNDGEAGVYVAAGAASREGDEGRKGFLCI